MMVEDWSNIPKLILKTGGKNVIEWREKCSFYA